MKPSQLLLALAAAGLAAAGGYALYRTGMNQGMQHVAAKAGDSSPASDRRILYWHDPMVPGQRFDKPGKSPFMDMQLVPVYADGGADEGNVSVSPRMQQNLGVRIAEVTRGVLAPALEAAGSVAYNERDAVVVQARASGFIERLHVRALLDPVRQGQPLAELYVPDWVAAQEEFLSLRRMQGRDLGSLVDAARQRMRLAGMTEEQAALVEASGRVQARQVIVAAAGGVVTELAAREGMTVAAGTPLFRINGLDTVWVNAEVPESLAAQVLPGNAVEARSPALAGTLFNGRVGAVLPEVNAATRTLKARIELANPSGRLLPGMFVAVNLAPAARKPVLLVPSEAVIQTGRRSVVVVALGEGKYASVEVATGLEADGRTEIRKGLEAGQKIVVSGQFLIDSEASLRASAGRMGDMKP